MRYLPLLLIGLLIFTIPACRSVKSLEESGDYDRAIDLAVKKLKGKSKKSPKIVAALEGAFNKAQDRDMRAINVLRDEGRDENWERVLRTAQGISRRQAKVEPLLPLIDKKGYQAEFKFIRVADIESESKERTADYLYQRAKRLLQESYDTGDKYLARESFKELEKLSGIYRNYRDVEILRRQARFAGTNYYLLHVENKSNTILPEQFSYRLTRMSTDDLNTSWREFHLQPQDQLDYDYKVQVLIREIAVSPESVKERQYDESIEIEDGFEYVLDSKGNVLKDSLGNDVKVPKKAFIKATVLEVYQSKAALVSGDLEIIDLRSNSVLKSETINVESIFENYASKLLSGDKRALSEQTKRRLGRSPLPFPTDGAMLIEAADMLKPIVRQKLRRFID
jgi:hypothetical protein